jgi:hypothetical protein
MMSKIEGEIVCHSRPCINPISGTGQDTGQALTENPEIDILNFGLTSVSACHTGELSELEQDLDCLSLKDVRTTEHELSFLMRWIIGHSDLARYKVQLLPSTTPGTSRSG